MKQRGMNEKTRHASLDYIVSLQLTCLRVYQRYHIEFWPTSSHLVSTCSMPTKIHRSIWRDFRSACCVLCPFRGRETFDGHDELLDSRAYVNAYLIQLWTTCVERHWMLVGVAPDMNLALLLNVYGYTIVPNDNSSIVTLWKGRSNPFVPKIYSSAQKTETHIDSPLYWHLCWFQNVILVTSLHWWSTTISLDHSNVHLLCSLLPNVQKQAIHE